MAASYTTYNQIIKYFNDFADAHYQIKNFFVGDKWDFATSGNVNYPAMLVVPTDSSLTGKVYNSNFTIFFMDQHHADQSEVDEIFSDMEQVAQDLIAQLQHPSYPFNFSPDNIPFRRFNDAEDDLLAGIAIDITIKSYYIYDRCAIPASNITIT